MVEEKKITNENVADLKVEKEDVKSAIKDVTVEKENVEPVKPEVVKEKSESAVKKIATKVPVKDVKEGAVELEREYVVPLRKGFLKAPRYRKAKKAVKTLQEFLAKHMRVENRDLRLVKIDRHLNNEIWHRGIKNPIPRVHVKAKKINGIVYAELATITEARQYKINKEDKKYKKVDKKALEKVVAQEAAEEKTKTARSDQSDKATDKIVENVDAKAAQKTAKVNAEKHTAKAPNTKMDNMAETVGRKSLSK
jgi:large subunit ribosomal protein L31e